MGDDGDIVLQFTNRIDYDSNDSDIEILSDDNCEHAASDSRGNEGSKETNNTASQDIEILSNGNFEYLAPDSGGKKSSKETDNTASQDLPIQRPTDRMQSSTVPNEIILLDSSDECDEGASNEGNNIALCRNSLRNPENALPNGLNCDKMRIKSISDEVTLQESNMRIEAFEIESDEELIMFDFSNFSADDVLRAVENDQLQSKEFHEANMSNSNAEYVDADTPVLQDPRQLISMVDLCCRTCSLLEKIEPKFLVKLCSKCNKTMIYQCKVCKTAFPTWFLICTHLNKCHKVQLSNGSSTPERVSPVIEQKQKLVAPAIEPDQRSGICYKCGIMFQSSTNLKIHEETCETSPHYLCKFCGLRTIAKKNLRQHLLHQHFREFKIDELDDILCFAFNIGVQTTGSRHLFVRSCLKCDTRSKLVTNEQDCETCNSPVIYECGDPNCSKSFFLLQELRCHVTMFHLRKTCDECLQPMESDEVMIKHAKSCGAPEKIPKHFCSACSYEAYSIHEFVLHLIKAHPMQRIAPLYKCSSCKSKKLYKTLKYFKDHSSHYCSKFRVLLRCAHCRYQTHDRKKLRVHLRCNHVELFTGKRLLCRKCGLRWSSIYKLNNHVGQCSGDPSVEQKKSKRKRRRLFNHYPRRKKT